MSEGFKIIRDNIYEPVYVHKREVFGEKSFGVGFYKSPDKVPLYYWNKLYEQAMSYKMEQTEAGLTFLCETVLQPLTGSDSCVIAPNLAINNDFQPIRKLHLYSKGKRTVDFSFFHEGTCCNGVEF